MRFNLKFLSKKDRQLIARAMRYVLPYKFLFVIFIICSLTGILAGLLQPLLFAKLITSIFSQNFSRLIFIISILIVLFVFNTGIMLLQSYLSSKLNQKIIFDIKRDMFGKILNLPVRAFDEMRIGEFISRLNGDAGSVALIITGQAVSIISDVFRIVSIGFIVFKLSVTLSLVVLAFVPVSLIIFIVSGKLLRQRNGELAKINDSYFSSIQESIAGIREVKSLGIKEWENNQFLSHCRNLMKKIVSIGLIGAYSGSVSSLVNFGSEMLVIVLGYTLMVAKKLTVENLIAFMSYCGQFTQAILNLTQLNSSIQQLLVSLDRIFELMDSFTYNSEKFGGRHMEQIGGRIHFDAVRFSYRQPGQDVLKGLSFTIKPNRKNAIVGFSGSGKTTIFNLILRFYDPQSGTVSIDDIPIHDFSEESLRRHIAIVRQEPFLFNMSIRENLLIGNVEAEASDMEKACKAAHIHEEILNFPCQYDTVVGERSVNLSIGQKQRLAIARSILKNSKIILFDEATSALDNESQFFIKTSLDEIAKSKTLIMIAHRLTTIIDADEIFVINEGKIAGSGTHSSLIQTNPIYKRLFEKEFLTIQRSSAHLAGQLSNV